LVQAEVLWIVFAFYSMVTPYSENAVLPRRFFLKMLENHWAMFLPGKENSTTTTTIELNNSNCFNIRLVELLEINPLHTLYIPFDLTAFTNSTWAHQWRLSWIRKSFSMTTIAYKNLNLLLDYHSFTNQTGKKNERLEREY
jgi:hypothetical protein